MTAQKNELVVVLELTKENAVKLFEEEGIFDHVDHIREREEAIVYDMKTKKGQDSCRSAAAKIAKTKTAIDKLRKDHNEGHRLAISMVNNIGSDAVDQMQVIQDNVRKPLTDLENVKKEFEQKQRDNIDVIKGFKATDDGMSEYSIDQLKARYDELMKMPVDSSFGEFEKEASIAKQESLDMIEMIIYRNEKLQREAKEAADNLAEENRLKQVENDARIRAEAKIEAEKAAQVAVDAEKAKVEQAEADRLEAANQHKKDQDQAEQKRIDDIAAAEQKVRDDQKVKDDQAEADRVQNLRVAAERAEDHEHRKAINNKILAGLKTLGIDEEAGKELIKAIVKGEVEYLQINY
jgi:hypothetical protein